MPSTARTRVDPRRERTRRKILDSLIELVQEQGVSGLTTVALAKRAGIHQPALYSHFKNLDEALAVAAAEICDRLRKLIGDVQRTVIFQGVSADQVAPALETILRAVLEERAFAAVFIGHRLDNSPLGKHMRTVMQDARADLTANLWNLATALRVKGEFYKRVELVADLMTVALLSAIETLVEKRTDDIAMVANILAKQVTGLATSELRAMVAASSAK